MDWKPGDRALCIDDSDQDLLVLGSVYTVMEITQWEGSNGLRLLEQPNVDAVRILGVDIGWHHGRFSKEPPLVDEDETENYLEITG